MLWTIARKELLSNLMSHRFVVATAVACAAILLAGWALLREYKTETADYQQALQTERQGNAEIRVWMHLEMWAHKPPTVLSVISKGLEGRVLRDVQVTFRESFAPRPAAAAGNPLMSVVPQLDLSLVVQVVLGLLALLMSYDAINGEREEGTLALMLANQTPRWALISGKLMAGLATMGVPCLLGFALLALMMSLDPGVEMSGEDWMRFALFFALSGVYLTAFFTVGIFLSACVRSSAVSLAGALGLYVFSVALVPNLTPVSTLAPMPSPMAMEDRVSDLWKEVDASVSRHVRSTAERYPGRDTKSDVSYSRGFFSAGATRDRVEMDRAKYAFGEPLQVACANQERELRLAAHRAVRQQTRIARLLSLPTLAPTFGDAAALIAGTDLEAYRHFLDQARVYRGQIFDYLAGKTRGFRDLSYFSPMTEQDVERYTAGDSKPYRNRKGADFPALDVRDAPVFVYRREGLASCLVRGALPLTALILTPILLSFATLVAFSRMNVTRD